MITQNSPSEKTEIAFLKAFKSLKLAELLRRSGIRKTQGISAVIDKRTSGYKRRSEAIQKKRMLLFK